MDNRELFDAHEDPVLVFNSCTRRRGGHCQRDSDLAVIPALRPRGPTPQSCARRMFNLIWYPTISRNMSTQHTPSVPHSAGITSVSAEISSTPRLLFIYTTRHSDRHVIAYWWQRIFFKQHRCYIHTTEWTKQRHYNANSNVEIGYTKCKNH